VLKTGQISVETVIHFIFQDYLMNKNVQKNSIYFEVESFVTLFFCHF